MACWLTGQVVIHAGDAPGDEVGGVAGGGSVGGVAHGGVAAAVNEPGEAGSFMGTCVMSICLFCTSWPWRPGLHSAHVHGPCGREERQSLHRLRPGDEG